MTKHSDLLTPEQRQKVIKDLIDYYATERDEELGVIAAEELLDMFLELCGKDICNNALDHFSAYFRDRFEDILVDADASLKK